MSREGRSQPVQPSAWHGFVDPGPAAVGTVPPQPVNIDRADQRDRYRTPAPIVLNGLLAGAAVAPSPSPPVPFVVPVEDRRRLARTAPDPVVLNGLLAGVIAAPTTSPPAPFVVPVERMRLRVRPTPDPLVISGVLASVPPPPPVTARLRTMLGVGT